MRGWIIFGCILLFFWLIGMIRANIEVCYSDSVRVVLKVLGIRLRLVPKQKKPPKLSDFSPKKYRKRLQKDETLRLKKELKKTKKQAKKDAKSAAKKKAAGADKQKDSSDSKQKKKKMSFDDIMEWIYVGLDALKGLGKSFGKHFEIEAVKLKIAVGTEDAAKTAILYGVIVQAAAYLIESLSAITNFRCKDRGQIQITADFLSDQLVMDLHLIFKLRVWHLFAILFSAAIAALKRLIGNKKTALEPSK